MKKGSQNGSIEQSSDLKVEFQQAAIAAARVTGWAALNRAGLVAQFKGRAGRSTLYRWLAQIDGALLDRTVDEMIQDARGGEGARVESVANEIQARVEATFLKVPTIHETVAATVPIEVMEFIRTCITASTDVMKRSRDSAGAVRNSKQLLAASEHLRRNLETAIKLQEAISDGLEVERFHQTIMEEIAKIDQAVAARIAARLLEVNSAWLGRSKNQEARQ